MRMRYCEISCDVTVSPECWENYGPEPTMTAVVKSARTAGWRIGPASAEEDACPECRGIWVEGHDKGDTFVAERLLSAIP